jgi:hypothetical protein
MTDNPEPLTVDETYVHCVLKNNPRVTHEFIVDLINRLRLAEDKIDRLAELASGNKAHR